MKQTRIKICGITRLEDALAAEAAGADAIGFVFWPESPRCVSMAEAGHMCACLSPGIASVGVFVAPDPEQVRRAIDTTGITTVQLCGQIRIPDFEEIGHQVRLIRSVSLSEYLQHREELGSVEDLMLDSHSLKSPGGTGTAFDWSRIPEIPSSTRLWLAGGLTPENVDEAIAAVGPFAVDVSSGVEVRPGIKSAEKIAQFVAAVRTADTNLPMSTA